jgi:hypothetical protein
MSAAYVRSSHDGLGGFVLVAREAAYGYIAREDVSLGMSTLSKTLVSLAVGLVAFLATGIAVTAVLDPHIWPSLFVGAPVGITVGVTASLATVATLRYRERRRVGELDAGVLAAYRASVVAVATCLVVVPLGTAAIVFDVGELGIAVLVFGLPACVLVAAVVAYVTVRRTAPAGRPPTA